MGELVKKQVAFNKARMDLELYMYYKGKLAGWYFVQEEAYRRPEATWGHKNSCHHYKLATHYFLFDKDFNWLHDVDPDLEKEIYMDAHRYWESQGGAPLIKNDLIHFSFAHNGVR